MWFTVSSATRAGGTPYIAPIIFPAIGPCSWMCIGILYPPFPALRIAKPLSRPWLSRSLSTVRILGILRRLTLGHLADRVFDGIAHSGAERKACRATLYSGE